MNQLQARDPLKSTVGVGVALVLVVFGLCVLGWALWRLYMIYRFPTSLGIFLPVIPEDPSLKQFVIQNQAIDVPIFFLQFLAYGLELMLYLIVALIGSSLLGRGVQLLK